LRYGWVATAALLMALNLGGCRTSPPVDTPAPVVAPAEALAQPAPTDEPAPTATATPVPTSTPTPTPTVTPTPPAPARLSASYPVHGEQQIPAERSLLLVFDRPMERESVAAHLAISPTVPGALSWDDDQRLRFAPAGGWESGVVYEASLGTGARSAEGGALEHEVTLRFQRDGRGSPLPVLMYHHVAELGPDATATQLDWTVSPAAFEEQMRYLEREGWQSISTADLAAYLLDGEPLPPRPVVISVDDGNMSFYQHGWPILRETRLRPVLFIVPQFTLYPAYMDWDQTRELVEGGAWVGSHSYDHQNMRQVATETLAWQVGESRDVLESELGVSVDGFCYPYGSFDQRTVDAMARHGYRTGYSLNPTYWQQAETPHFIGRLRVDYRTSLEDFIALLPRW
jgi:peptidoglycan/xylan/chitin deacetylase (PgdA/CDA1 family)